MNVHKTKAYQPNIVTNHSNRALPPNVENKKQLPNKSSSVV